MVLHPAEARQPGCRCSAVYTAPQLMTVNLKGVFERPGKAVPHLHHNGQLARLDRHLKGARLGALGAAKAACGGGRATGEG